MLRSEYKALAKTSQGQRIRNLFAGGHTSKSEIRAAIAEAGIPEEFRGEVFDALVDHERKLAKVNNPYERRGAGDDLALRWLRKIRAADSVFGDDGIPAERPDAEDDDATARRVRARSRGLTDQQHEAEEEERAERQRLERRRDLLGR